MTRDYIKEIKLKYDNLHKDKKRWEQLSIRIDPLLKSINEIRKIYKNRFYDKMNLLTSLIQPIFLIVIMALILWIVLAIFMPIWNMGTMINT